MRADLLLLCLLKKIQEEEQRRAEIALAYSDHRRGTSVTSTDSSLASLPLSPSYVKNFRPTFEGLAVREEEETTDSSPQSVPRRYVWRTESGLSLVSGASSTPVSPSGPKRRGDLERGESGLSSAPVSPSNFKRRGLSSPDSPQAQPEVTSETRGGEAHSAGSPEKPAGKPGGGGKLRGLVKTWQGIVEAATRDGAPEDLRATQFSSLPGTLADAAEESEELRAARFSSTPGAATASEELGKTRRYSMPDLGTSFGAGGEDVEEGRQDGVPAPAVPRPKSTIGGRVYNQLFSKKGGAPSAVLPVQAKARASI